MTAAAEECDHLEPAVDPRRRRSQTPLLHDPRIPLRRVPEVGQVRGRRLDSRGNVDLTPVAHTTIVGAGSLDAEDAPGSHGYDKPRLGDHARHGQTRIARRTAA